MFQDVAEWVTHPFKKDMSIGHLLLFIVLFAIIAFVVFDMLRILKSWMASTTEAVAETIA